MTRLLSLFLLAQTCVGAFAFPDLLEPWRSFWGRRRPPQQHQDIQYQHSDDMSFPRFFSDPFFTLEEFHRGFDEAFARFEDSFFNRSYASSPGRAATRAAITFPGSGGNEDQAVNRYHKPRLDLRENEDHTVTATFDLPGMRKEDVNIEVHNNRLTISGESKVANDRDNDGYIVRERRWGKFTRTLPLPEGTDTDKIQASVVDGVLTVTFPKADKPDEGRKRITVS